MSKLYMELGITDRPAGPGTGSAKRVYISLGSDPEHLRLVGSMLLLDEEVKPVLGTLLCGQQLTDLKVRLEP